MNETIILIYTFQERMEGKKNTRTRIVEGYR